MTEPRVSVGPAYVDMRTEYEKGWLAGVIAFEKWVLSHGYLADQTAAPYFVLERKNVHSAAVEIMHSPQER